MDSTTLKLRRTGLLFLTVMACIAGQSNLKAMNIAKSTLPTAQTIASEETQAKRSLSFAILGLGATGIFSKFGGPGRPIYKLYSSLPDTNIMITVSLQGAAALFTLYHAIKYWKYFSKTSQPTSKKGLL